MLRNPDSIHESEIHPDDVLEHEPDGEGAEDTEDGVQRLARQPVPEANREEEEEELAEADILERVEDDKLKDVESPDA